MFSNFFCCRHTWIFYNLRPFGLITFSFEFHLWVICDVTTMSGLFIMFSLFRILVKWAETVIMDDIRTLMDFISP